MLVNHRKSKGVVFYSLFSSNIRSKINHPGSKKNTESPKRKHTVFTTNKQKHSVSPLHGTILKTTIKKRRRNDTFPTVNHSKDVTGETRWLRPENM